MKLINTYSNIDELKEVIRERNLDIPFSDNLEILKENLELNGKVIPNKLAIHPLEGCDSELNGAPSKLTERRYLRYARGKAGLIWLEATAVSKEARANDKQLFLNHETVNEFVGLVKKIKEESLKSGNQVPYLVLQLAHSGRFGENKIIAIHDEKLDELSNVNYNTPVITDDELKELENFYVEASKLAKKAGFDAIDIKSCHKYLLSEILGARTRKGIFGGKYENRTRFIKEVVDSINKEVGIDIAVRLNISDFLHYPISWGTNKKGEVDLSEPLKLIEELREKGVKLINVTAGSPYINPHINRPADGEEKKYTPPEHPLIGVERLIKFSKNVQEKFRDIIVVGTGLSWFRHFVPFVAAGMVEKGYCKIVGLGRMAFAYPDFAKDIIENKKMEENKSCITCNRCAELKAHQEITGCVIRDKDVYLKPYMKILRKSKSKR
ncbi:NADH:flavin oxidoreductase [Petrotoga mexicana]|uniref:oxidoreductase n=1 Tax=Petrotoga mexicana TaxID=204046 RepID=UPI003CCB99D5